MTSIHFYFIFVKQSFHFVLYTRWPIYMTPVRPGCKKLPSTQQNNWKYGHPCRDTIPIFPDILNYIYTLLRTVKQKPSLNTFSQADTIRGNVTQSAYLIRVSTDYGRNITVDCLLLLHSYSTVGPHITSTATIFIYPVERYLEEKWLERVFQFVESFLSNLVEHFAFIRQR